MSKNNSESTIQSRISSIKKLEECNFRMKKVNIYLENTNMTFDSQSHIRIGENKIGEDNGLIITSKTGNILRISEELSWEADSCKIKWGGYDLSGGKVIVGTDDWYMGKKDDFVYHNGRQLFRIYGNEIYYKKVDILWNKIKDKVYYQIDENEDIIEINGDKYVDQMMINMILIEKIKKLEAKIARIQ